ncbi:hypothetical protein MUY27_09305 [Mucilaginibacter sp. RS28]|uniref:WD40-like Beta Propeller Repeat n=1 Tax=Mucilaginibacter straminoryzae TaxID=2932774 RepID=A0A9X1X4F0_9SPHI|nr:hypothetical protein [Mucilaginibacter straminoryzae]MCJ8209905.1 hypothetical protein [Mucilaginibacter straminoryzae]
MFKFFTPKSILIGTLLVFNVIIVRAQQFGGNPPSVKWKQINLPAARVIFPAGADSTARRVASIIQQMNNAVKPTIGTKQRQVNIVLQSQTLVSNGFVMLAPFRSEFYLTPEQNSFQLGSLPWAEQLATHEFRHVQQYNNFDVGLSRALHILFGESGQLLGNTVAIPDWFYEGDAVFNETHVTDQGRGRLPYFFNGFRGIWEAGKNYSWMKLRNGSYVDYTPDWYPLGYMMNAYGREKYGPMFWRNVTHSAAAFNRWVYPFQYGIKKYAGEDYKQFRSEALDYFKEKIVDPVNLKSQLYKSNQHFIADQEYPAVVDDSTLIYVKSTYSKRPTFVIRNGRNEKEIRVKDLSLDRYFDYNNGKIVYASFKPDLRWGYRNYNELRIMDVASGTEKKITSKTKYFSPAFSEDGSKIVVVQVEPGGKSTLQVLNTADGTVINAVPNPSNLFYTYPKFYHDQLLAAVRNASGAMTIALINPASGDFEALTPYSKAPVSFLNVADDKVYFSGTTGMNDRLYVLNMADKKLYRLQNDTLQHAIGNYEPFVKGNRLAWASFTAYGYQLHQADLNQIQQEPVEQTGQLQDYGISSLKKDSAADLLARVKTENYPVKKYSKLHNFFNFHSLLPDFEDPDYTLSISGENVINTFQSELYGTYNRDESYKKFGYNAAFGAWFPYLVGGVNYTVDRRATYRGQYVYWNESEIHGGLRVPLNFSGGTHSTFLTVGSETYYSNQHFQKPFQTLFRDGSFTYQNTYLSFSNQIQQPVQNIYPRWAQTFGLSYRKGIISQYNYQVLATSNLYFPGLGKNHSLVFGLAHQQRSKDAVIDFSNNFPFSRGYTVYNLYKMDKVSANYHFPIAYPDKGFGELIYLLRLRGNLYFDYSHAQDFYTNNTQFKGDFRSTGAELFFDTQWFNQLPLTFGLRYTRLLDTDLGGRGQNRIELVVPLTLF